MIMAIHMSDCVQANENESFKGVIQIGSHLGEDAKAYEESGVRNVIWIDANQDVFKPLYESTRNFAFQSKYYNVCLTDKDDELLEFKVMDKQQYSSLLEVGSSPLEQLSVKETRRVRSKRFETFIRENIVDIDLNLYDFIRLDTQGMELKVLQGFGPLFERFPFKAVYTEVSFEETYKGGCTYEELDSFLTSLGFQQTLLASDGPGGDALYLRDV